MSKGITRAADSTSAVWGGEAATVSSIAASRSGPQATTAAKASAIVPRRPAVQSCRTDDDRRDGGNCGAKMIDKSGGKCAPSTTCRILSRSSAPTTRPTAVLGLEVRFGPKDLEIPRGRWCRRMARARSFAARSCLATSAVAAR